MTFSEVIRTIECRREMPDRQASFERFRASVAALDLKIPKRGGFLIAGTNGKGTVAKTLETLLLAGGEAVGLYTSPHLMTATERIRSHGRDLTPEEFVVTYELVRDLAERFELTHFEILTVMMAEVFFGGRVRPPVSRAVLEVGMGGRLDPTRAFHHEICVITSLSLDHTDVLGPDLASIAREKFAIVEPGNLVLHGPLTSEVQVVAEETRARMASRWIEVPEAEFRVEQGADPVWVLKTEWGETRLKVLGARGAANTALALKALQAADFPVESHLHVLSEVAWPCRMERFVVANRRVYLSGDHNPEGVCSLKEILAHFQYRHLFLIVGIGLNKDHEAMLREFVELPRAKLALTETPFRPGPLANYGTWLEGACDSDRDVHALIPRILARVGPEDLVLISGSLYLVGDVRQAIVSGRYT